MRIRLQSRKCTDVGIKMGREARRQSIVFSQVRDGDSFEGSRNRDRLEKW